MALVQRGWGQPNITVELTDPNVQNTRVTTRMIGAQPNAPGCRLCFAGEEKVKGEEKREKERKRDRAANSATHSGAP